MMSVGSLVSLRIDKPAAGGRMIARLNGQIVLVGGAIPGELVTARIERVAKGVAFADTVSVEEPSPDRRQPSADPACGGNLYAHIDYTRQLAIKADVIADGLARIGRVIVPAPVAVAASPGSGYRMRARLHVQQGRIGFFREGSRQLCDPRATGQLLATTCDVLETLGDACRAHQFNQVREIELAENRDASQRVVHLDSAVTLRHEPAAALGRIAGLTGLTVAQPGVQDGAPSVGVVSGVPHVTDILPLIKGPVTLKRHVLAFFQANRYLLAGLVDHVAGLVGSSSRVIDLYAGVGLFAVALARTTAATVVAVESDRQAALDLETNAAASGGIEVVHRTVESFLGRRRPAPDVAIVDPPRTGLSAEALTGLLALAAPRVVYVSCDIATMARDVRGLVTGGYTVGRIDAFDLFPNTPHVETVMVLSRE
jgi:23S rRNA (uracil1939-C5)-methyltransferase